ncbi:DUF4124 domain-containing protein [Marinobacter sp.]|uniref:DUF4124 domain-containing protein n=1 Tax=Marinobacter sp. TaxID=50741 RepID=UPI00356AABFC
MQRIATALFYVVMAVPAHAEIYRWTDDRGATHFSDTPPHAQEHSRVTLQEPVTVPLHVNLRQSEKVSQSRRSVERMLEPENKQRFAEANKINELKEAQCEQYRLQLEQVRAQLKAGYGNEQGNHLRQKRRKFQTLFSNNCILD